MDTEKIAARIRALREKTQAQGCTEAEAIAAAEKAAELLAAYGLDEADLDIPEFCEGFGVTTARRTPLDGIWPGVAVFCGCACWMDSRATRIVYLGRPGDVLVAEYVHQVIVGAAERATKEFRAGPLYTTRRTAKTRANAVRGFREGFAVGIAYQLSEGLWRRLRAAHDLDSRSQMLVLIAAHLDPIKAEIERRGIALSPRRPIAAATGQFRDAARVAGASAGRAVEINAGVTSSAARSVALPAAEGRR